MKTETKEFLDFALSRHRETFPFNEKDNRDRFYTFSGIMHDICEKWDAHVELLALEEISRKNWEIIGATTTKERFRGKFDFRRASKFLVGFPSEVRDCEIICENGEIVSWPDYGDGPYYESAIQAALILELTKIEE